MSTTLDLTGLDRIAAGLRALGDFDATPLMLAWELIIEQDNRTGILRGLDKDGMPMIPVKYRPRPPGPVKPTKAQRAGARANAKRGVFQGFGHFGAGLHGNLLSAEYRLLGGPPLAPRGPFSRVITNLKTGHGRDGARWYAMGYWEEVISDKLIPFLRFHFDGTGRLPRRDLRGVRPAGVARALEALKAFGKDMIRRAFERAA